MRHQLGCILTDYWVVFFLVLCMAQHVQINCGSTTIICGDDYVYGGYIYSPHGTGSPCWYYTIASAHRICIPPRTTTHFTPLLLSFPFAIRTTLSPSHDGWCQTYTHTSISATLFLPPPPHKYTYTHLSLFLTCRATCRSHGTRGKQRGRVHVCVRR